MALSLLTSLIGNATDAQGTSNSSSTPNVSPGLDPGRYAFELWFNKERREEEAKEREKERALKTRAMNMTGIGMLAQERQQAEENSRLRTFRNGLFSNNTAGIGA
jgi:hypothetical protein